MFCRNCGKEIGNNNICDACGTPVVDNVPLNNGYQMNQPMNYQNNMGGIPVGNNVNPYQMNQPMNMNLETPEDKKKADKLCLISLLLFFIPDIVGCTILRFIEDVNDGISAVFALCPLAAIVLMIVARVKYPKNKFAKILMWVYIALIIAGILFLILILAACAACLSGFSS